MKTICDKGWQSGECCCNCKNQKKLMCHPWNGNNKAFGFIEDKIKFGKGNISDQCGYVCTAQFDDGSNKDRYLYFDFQHGFCEFYQRK